MRIFKHIFAIVLGLLVLTGCSSDKNGENTQPIHTSHPEVSAIVLSTNSIEISVDETYQLIYTTLPNDAKDVDVSWRSTDESVVSVDETGVISGIGEGQTNVIAECENGVYEVCQVTVAGKSAYDSLSKKEKEFVDLFVENMTLFYDPKSVTLKYYHHLKSGDIEVWDITVSAHNQMGGFSEKDYTMDISGNITEPILNHVIMPGWEKGCNLDLINDAIKECVK